MKVRKWADEGRYLPWQFTLRPRLRLNGLAMSSHPLEG